ncbi:hypothetical protein [Nioella nitratireducens]|uniref:hypothetical protein n=1 Tax=Nioella nitratireducens TaxID=1287720 RepID=UPI0008FD383D|nr:hypothetical protein [Nioella nitratireducens]
MDLIAFTPVVTPAQSASGLIFALDSLDARLDTTGDLEGLLDITGHGDAVDDTWVIGCLHLPPGASPEDGRHLFEDAMPALERLLNRVWSIPLEGAFTDPSVLDAGMLRSEAGLEKVLTALNLVLAT